MEFQRPRQRIFYRKKSYLGNYVLNQNCFFTIGNMVFKQDIGILMSYDSALFWGNLFLYFLESKHSQNLISKKSTTAYKYHATSRFIGDLCAVNNQDEFSKPFKYIYPRELELKIEHSGTHGAF